MTELRLTGADILDPEGWTRRDLAWSDGTIGPVDARAVDLEGYRVLPGIIDAHGDGFERHMAPRRGPCVQRKAVWSPPRQSSRRMA